MVTELDPRCDRDALFLYLDSAIDRLNKLQERQRQIIAEHRAAIEAHNRKLPALLAGLQQSYDSLCAAYTAAHGELMKAARV